MKGTAICSLVAQQRCTFLTWTVKWVCQILFYHLNITPRSVQIYRTTLLLSLVQLLDVLCGVAAFLLSRPALKNIYCLV